VAGVGARCRPLGICASAVARQTPAKRLRSSNPPRPTMCLSPSRWTDAAPAASLRGAWSGCMLVRATAHRRPHLRGAGARSFAGGPGTGRQSALTAWFGAALPPCRSARWPGTPGAVAPDSGMVVPGRRIFQDPGANPVAAACAAGGRSSETRPVRVPLPWHDAGCRWAARGAMFGRARQRVYQARAPTARRSQGSRARPGPRGGMARLCARGSARGQLGRRLLPTW
jgi:hypothetical protein